MLPASSSGQYWKDLRNDLISAINRGCEVQRASVSKVLST